MYEGECRVQETFDDWDVQVHLSTYLSVYHERTALATWNLMVRRGECLMIMFGIGHMEPDWSLGAYLGLTWIRHISLADPCACPCHATPCQWPICIPTFMSSKFQQCITAHCTGSFLISHKWENPQL